MKTPSLSRVMKRTSRMCRRSLFALLLSSGLVHAQVPQFTTLVEFTGVAGNKPGGEPVSPLVEVDGNFYGTTLTGGSGNYGTVFKMTSAGALQSLVSFTGATGTAIGFYPYAGVTHSNGSLYGVTNGVFDFSSGIPNAGYGTNWKVSTAGTGYTMFFKFGGTGTANKGRAPKGTLVLASDGNFYGTTEFGGANDHGTIFRTTAAGVFTYIVDFTNNGGSNKGSRPNARLIDGNDGYLYGSTLAGGAGGVGTLFRLKLSNGTLETLAQFTNTSGTTPGANPVDQLCLASDGNFYGTTLNGGSLDFGTVFRLRRTPSVLVTTLVHFSNFTGTAQGAAPFGGLVQANDGNLYGTTRYGGVIRPTTEPFTA
jgi:uncharacterized repeat protein (TIGR03803 family)